MRRKPIIIGWDRLGRPIWSIAGASNPEPDDFPDEPQDEPQDEPKDDKPKAPKSWMDDLPADVKSKVLELARTARGATAEARRASEELDRIKQAGMTDQQRMEDRLKRLEAALADRDVKLRTEAIKNAFADVGRRHKAKNPSRLWREFDRDDIQIDEERMEVLNAEDLVAQLKKSDPYLFEPAGGREGGADAGNRQPSKPNSNDWMNRAIRRTAQRS